VVDGHRGAEIQRLSIPEAQRGSFTLTVEGDTATVTTAPIYLTAPVQQQLLVTDSTDFNLTYVTSAGVQTITGLSTGAATDDISTTIANQINTKLATEFGLAAGTKVVSVTKNQAGYLITYTNQNNMVEFTGVVTSASGNVAVFTKETKAALNYVAVAQRIENAIYKAMALPAGTPKTILVTAGETAGTFDLHWRVVGDKAITTLTDISLSAPVVDLTLTASTTGSPQVHEITIPQAVGASPYNLYIGTYKTVELERDADKNAVQSALQKLINQKPTLKGTVTVTGTAAGPFTISIAGGSVASIVAKNSVFTGTVLGTSTITSQLTNGQEVQSLNINGASRGVVGLQYNLKTYADNSLVTGSVFVDVTLQAGETADTLRGRIEAALNTELAGKATATVTLSGDKFVITLSSLTHIVESMGGTGYGLSSAATDQSLTPVKVGRIDAYLDRTDSSNTTLVETNRIYKFAMPPVVAGETISGSFTFGFGGVTTGAINYSADNTTLLANINAALTASAINTLPVTLEGNEFRVEVVVDLSAAEQALIVDGSALQIVKDTAVAAPGVPANIVTIANGSAVSVGEKQRVTLVDQSLTSFRLSVNGISTLDIPVNQNDATTRGAIQSALDAALGANKVTVTVNPDSSKTKSWILEVTGTSRLNDTDTLVAGDNANVLTGYAKDDFTQTVLTSLLGKQAGFSGRIQNIDNVTYGAGLNIALNTTLNPVAALGNASLGSNVFEVGGNLIENTIANPYAQYIANAVVSTAINGEPSLFSDNVVAPGVHVLAGGWGSDTYKFSGLWGATAVIEAPDIKVAGVSDFFDTLDLSDAGYGLKGQLGSSDVKNTLH